MRSLGLRLSMLFLATVPLACGQSTNGSGSGGSTGGSGTGGSSGVGGSGPKGGSGGSSATGGNTGKGGSTGGVTGQGGAAGVGGSEPGGAGGSQPGGAGGSGTGGSNPGGAGGSSQSDGSAGATGGVIDGGGDAISGATCTNKKADGDETDTDCGGGTCPKCDGGKACKQDSDCKSASCDSGKCVDPFAATGTITSSTDNRTWTITLGTTVLAVQVAGAKVVTYSLDGTNFLVAPENGGSFGSVFWIAPQSEWPNGWPPPSEMDENATFTASSKDNILTMSIAAGSDGLSISKRFWGNTKFQTVTLEYTFKNNSSATVKKAPWEITRVFPGGLTFFPTAETPVTLPGTCNCFKEIPFTTSAGVAWWKYQKATFTESVKGGANGSEGWAAHVNCGSALEKTCTSSAKSMILIKQWADSTTEAPGEKEIELYGDPGHTYVEFEQQGDYQSVPAGASVVWTMRWMLRYLPSNLAPTPGSAELVDWVRKQLL